jgi:hypothetical protein
VGALIRYQVDLTGGPDRVYLSGLPDSKWLAQDVVRKKNMERTEPVFGISFLADTLEVPGRTRGIIFMSSQLMKW